jgi:hypothetical protein
MMNANLVLTHAPHFEILERGGDAAHALLTLPGRAGDKLRKAVAQVAHVAATTHQGVKAAMAVRDDVKAATDFLGDLSAAETTKPSNFVWQHLGAAIRGRGLDGDDQSDESEDVA